MPRPDRALLTRLRELELAVAIEFLIAVTILLLVVVMFAGSVPLWPAIAVPVVVTVVGYSTYRRWRVRAVSRSALLRWSTNPIEWTGSLVVQRNGRGEVTGTIDPENRYTVRWEKFSDDRALYLVTQDAQLVRVSTLAPNAGEILVTRLKVVNYPCEEWPNLDL